MTLTIFNDLVAGLSFSRVDTSDMEVEDLVNLVPEPTNEYDARAIRVDHATFELKLGYIPKDQTAQIHSAWDNGLSVKCWIRHIKPAEGKTYSKIWLRATIELPSE